jgi:hypothetical protein
MQEGKWTPLIDTHTTIDPKDLEKKKQQAENPEEKSEEDKTDSKPWSLKDFFKNRKN